MFRSSAKLLYSVLLGCVFHERHLMRNKMLFSAVTNCLYLFAVNDYHTAAYKIKRRKFFNKTFEMPVGK